MAKRYRWTHSKPLARGNAIRQPDGLLLPGPDATKNFIREGDVFVPTAAELRDFGDRIEEVTEEEAK